MAQAQSRVPELFGAPSAPDPGGAFSASVQGAQANAALQAQAALQASQLVLSSLQMAMDVANRRDMQRNEIEAGFKLQGIRDAAEDARQDKGIKAARDLALIQEKGATHRTRMGETGANKRTLFGERGTQGRFDTTMGFQRSEADRAAGFKREELEAMWAELGPNLLAKNDEIQRGRAIDWARSQVRNALPFMPLVPGQMPGQVGVDLEFINRFAGGGAAMRGAGPGMEAAGPAVGGAIGGPMGAAAGAGLQGAGREATQRGGEMQAPSGGMYAMLELFQQMAQAQSRGPEEAATIAARGAGSGDGFEFPAGAQFPVRPDQITDALKNLPPTHPDVGLLNQIKDKQVFFEPATGRYSVPGATPNIIDALTRAMSSHPGSAEINAGRAAFPDLPRGDQLNRGAGIVNRAKRGQTAQPGPGPEATPQPEPKPRPKPAAKPGRPVKPGEFDEFQGSGVANPPAAPDAAPSQQASEETRARDAAAKFKAKYGIGSKQPGQPTTAAKPRDRR